MPFDPSLASRLRNALSRRRGITEKKMFGGLAFLAGGKMFCGIVGDRLMVRVGPERYERALARRHVREMDFTGRPMRGYVFVEPAGVRGEAALSRWLDEALAHARTLPGKRPR